MFLEGSCDFMDAALHCKVTYKFVTLPSCLVIDTVLVDILILVCHVILQDHVIKGSCGFMAKSTSR